MIANNDDCPIENVQSEDGTCSRRLTAIRKFRESPPHVSNGIEKDGADFRSRFAIFDVSAFFGLLSIRRISRPVDDPFQITVLIVEWKKVI